MNDSNNNVALSRIRHKLGQNRTMRTTNRNWFDFLLHVQLSPGVVATEPIGALAHLQLGRAFALSGDKENAKTAYQDFLTLWKDADPDIPILKQAKAEYAKLH